jgi:hypothetical protein
MDWEPLDAFTAFEAYLNQGTRGSRQASAIALDKEIARRIRNKSTRVEFAQPATSDEGVPPSRTVNSRPTEHGQEILPPAGKSTLASGTLGGSDRGQRSVNGSNDAYDPTSIHQSIMSVLRSEEQEEEDMLQAIQEWSTIYFWHYRVHAYDRFYVTSIRRSRDMTALALESDHYLTATRLADHALMMMGLKKNEHNEFMPEALDDGGQVRFWKEAGPKTVLEVLAYAQKLQRISVGLPSAGPTGSQATRTLPSPAGSGSGSGSGPPTIQGVPSSQAAPLLSGPSGNGSRAGSTINGTSSTPGSLTAEDAQMLTTDDRAQRIKRLLDLGRARQAGAVGTEQDQQVTPD